MSSPSTFLEQFNWNDTYPSVPLNPILKMLVTSRSETRLMESITEKKRVSEDLSPSPGSDSNFTDFPDV